MDKSKIFITLASVVGIIAFIIAAYYATNQQKPVATYEQVKNIGNDENIKWSKAKKHILVEYSDLQCPACQSFHNYLKSSIDKDKSITDNITFVYRHFPLIVAHPFANDAAYAAEAAGMQGKFFEMIDLQFTNQKTWATAQNPREIFRGYADKLKLDLEKYDTDVASDKVKQRVSRDVQSGNEVGVSGTPSFFLNGNKVEVASFEEFKQLLVETAKLPAPTSGPTVVPSK